MSQWCYHMGMAKSYFNKISVPGTRVWDINQSYRSVYQDVALNSITYPMLNGSRPVETFQTSYTSTFCAPITMETDVLGRQWPLTYDTQNRLKTFKLPLNGNDNPYNPVYTYNYNASNTEFVQPSGLKITEYYDGGTLTQIKDQAGFFNTYKYDLYYNVSEATDAYGRISYFAYDGVANLKSSQDPKQKLANVKEESVYNSWNDVLSTKDCRGVSTYYNRGALPGTLINVVDGKGNTLVTNTYNSDGTMASTSSQGSTCQLLYDNHYRLANIVTSDGNVQINYGASDHRIGKPISTTTRLGTSYLQYDEWSRLTGTTRYDNATASVILNAMGYVSSASDFLNRTSSITQDAIGRTKIVTNARGDVESYSFDIDGNIQSITNGRNKTRTFAYTPRGELRLVNYADGLSERSRFDGNGNQTQRINGMLQTIGYEYDIVDNVTKVDYPTGVDTTFSYDNDGRQMNMVDSTGTSSWEYDNADNVTKLTTPQGVMDYVYDVWNRRISMNEGGGVTNYGFTNHRLSNISRSDHGDSTTFTYDQFGRVVSKTNGSVRSEYSYDGRDRLSSVSHINATSNQPFHTEFYIFDAVDNLRSKTENSVTTIYNYDNIDQLISESGGGVSNSYVYDANGNRTSRVSATGTEIYHYDDADKLMSVDRPSGTTSYAYDDCGRPTNIGSKSLTWDYEDNLRTLSLSGVATSNYSYNGIGARIGKSGAFGTKNYKRDGVGVTNPVLSDGATSTVPGLTEKNGGVVRSIHANHLGSTMALTVSGNVTDTRRFDAFGNGLGQSGTTSTQKGFGGDWGIQEDDESGLKLVGHRYYDADTGRFLTRDPAESGRNWYVYCKNNPLSFIDPTGLGWGRIIGGIVGGIAGGIIGTVVAPGPGSLYGGALGTAYGSWLGSMIDGDSPGDAAENGLVDGVTALAGGYIFGKIAGRLGQLIKAFFGRGASETGALTPRAAGVVAADSEGAAISAAGSKGRPIGRPGWENKPFPRGGGHYNSEGYPVFDQVFAETTITPTGNSTKDIRQAWRNAGFKPNNNYTWHHHEDVGRMQLVDAEVHSACPHRGGYWLWGELMSGGSR